MLKISFVGDVNPGGVLTFTGGVSKEVIDLLADADLRVGTLECAFGDCKNLNSYKLSDPNMAGYGCLIYAPDYCVKLLKKLNINVVSLANNHIGDLSEEGISHTIDVLESNNILYVGAGKSKVDAQRPLVITINGKTICFLAYCTAWKIMKVNSKLNEPQVNLMDEHEVIKQIIENKGKYDYVIVLPHWGKENTIFPQLKVMRLCKLIQKNGADAIIGSHTHYLQPTYISHGTIISPSLGNFVFPDRYIDSPRITVYPSEQERDNTEIPVVDGFPIVSVLTYKQIKGKARIGGILQVKFAEITEYKRQLTRLNNDNVIELYVDSRLERRLGRLAKIIKHYSIYKVYLCIISYVKTYIKHE